MADNNPLNAGVLTETHPLEALVAAAHAMQKPSLDQLQASLDRVNSVFFHAGVAAGILTALEMLPGVGVIEPASEQHLALLHICDWELRNVTGLLQAILNAKEAIIKQQREQQQQREAATCSSTIQ